LRESADESLGEERIREHMEFQVRLTQAAEANDKAGSRERTLWRRSGPMASSILMLPSPLQLSPAPPLFLLFPSLCRVSISAAFAAKFSDTEPTVVSVRKGKGLELNRN
jgi:hypothetical protein